MEKRPCASGDYQGGKDLITRPAIKVTQGSLTLYATTLKVEDFLRPNFYRVDKLDAKDEGSGFQRVLDRTRAKRLAQYIVNAWDDGDASLPTSVFLATDRELAYDPAQRTLTFDPAGTGPFNVVDGQHRIEGLILAARENPKIKEFEIIANIAVGLDEVSQMCHFLIVNTTQKAVDKAVEQQIIARLSGMIDLEDIPTLPKWIQKQVLKGEDREALVIANYLNTDADSPWQGRIRMANTDRKDNNSINQNSFVQITKMYILSSNNPLAAVPDIDKRNKIVRNYWQAIASLLADDPTADSVLFKTIGLELFSLISATVFNRLFVNQDFRVETIRSLLQNGLTNLPSEHLAVQHPDWWKSGGGASGINKGAARKIAHELNKAINSPSRMDDDVLL